MNLFEKIFNFQLLSKLEESGTVAITAQERSWLLMMLDHAGSEGAFSAEMQDKLREALTGETAYDLVEMLLQKGESVEKPLFPPHLHTLRRIIRKQGAARLTCRVKGGRLHAKESCFPYKLEYSMVKREWYLLWVHRRRHALMRTRLALVEALEDAEISSAEVGRLLAEIERRTEALQEEAVVEIIRRYNPELSRILYAFSCFDREVEYAEETDTYRVRLRFPSNEREYVLSKLRFLGQRVRVAEGDPLIRRMRESALKALERYVDPVPASEEGSSPGTTEARESNSV